MRKAPWIFAFWFCFWITSGFGETVTVEISGQKTVIPIPEGFSRMDGVNPKINEYLKKGTPPGIRIAASFAPTDDVEAFKRGEPRDLRHSFQVLVNEKVENI